MIDTKRKLVFFKPQQPEKTENVPKIDVCCSHFFFFQLLLPRGEKLLQNNKIDGKEAKIGNFLYLTKNKVRIKSDN